MSKIHLILQKILKLFGSKNRKIIAITLTILSAFIAFAYVDYLKFNEDLKVNKNSIYQIKQGDDLFSINRDELKKVSKIVVVSPNGALLKDIYIKFKGSENVSVFKGVGREAFFVYSTSILEPYIKEQTLDFRYMDSTKGIHKRLEVKKDPELIAEPPKVENGFSIWSILPELLFMGLIFFMLFKFQGKSLTTAPEMILPNNIKDSLDDLVGLDDIKSELLQLEEMVLNQELYKKYNIDKHFNVLMTGPAGVGKTKIARCLAKRLDIPLVYGSAAGLQSGYVGGGARALRQLVKMASKHSRAIIFIDEAESILQDRQGVKEWERETINALLALVDGVHSSESEIIWMFASNMDDKKMKMDDAVKRRCQLEINFRLPIFDERKELLRRLISKLDSDTVSEDINLTHLAGVTSGMSPALLETMVSRASLMAVQDESKVRQEILMKAFERVAVGLTDRETTANMDEKRLLIARHEIGHFIVKLHDSLTKSNGKLENLKDFIDVIKISTESVSKGSALGFVLSKEQELKLENRDEYELQIMQLYGGMVNEEIYYHEVGVTAGAHNDIEKASRLLKVMIGEVGYYQKHKLNYSVILKNGEMSEEQIKLIEDKSKDLYSKTFDLLSGFMPLTDLMVDRLMADYVLNVDDAILITTKFFKDNPTYINGYITNEPKVLSA